MTGGIAPVVDMKADRQNGSAVLKLIRTGLVSCAHDCSKGGLAVALAEMAVAGSVGFKVKLDSVPNSCQKLDELLFSESHSRYIIGTKDPEGVKSVLSSEGVPFAQLGTAAGKGAEFARGKNRIRLTLKALEASFSALEKAMQQ